MKTGRSCRHRPATDLNGGITVFLSLIFTCICALMAGLLESARAAGSGWYLQTALDSSLESLLSQYHRELWENYHLLLLEYNDSNQLETEMRPYLDAYLDADAAYGLDVGDLTVEDPICVTQADGRYLEQEILDYMKLGIWTMEKDPQALSELSAGMKEAVSLGDIASHYQSDTRKAVRLEQALEDIGSCLKKQEERLSDGERELRDCDGRGFLNQAEELQRELNKIPGLIETYEAAARALQEELSASEAEAREKKGDLTDETWRMLSGQMDQYRSYTDQEGERHRQVLETGKRAKENLLIVESAMEEARDTLDYIADWEPDDEDDELDEEPLWNAVLRTVSRFERDHAFTEPGIRDKGKMNLLQELSRLAKGDVLPLVLPEGTELSHGAEELSSLPSKRSGGTGETSAAGVEDLAKAAFIDEYAACHFTNFLSEEEKEFKYEQEYILNGQERDRENLRMTVNRLLLVREAMNLLHLFRDPEKRREAEGLAASITGAAAISPLIAITTFFILTVWAFAESLEDVRALLRGEKVPFVKTREEWKLDLETMLRSKKPGRWQTVEGGKEKGFSYQDYLKLFFLLEDRVRKDYRIMDMIQVNIRRRQSSFSMACCAYQVKAECQAEGRLIALRRQSVKAY